MISPYHMPIIDNSHLHTDLMLSVDEDFPYIYHSRKQICKLRSIFEKDNSWIFYQEYPEKSLTSDEKYANQISFLVNSLLFNWIFWLFGVSGSDFPGVGSRTQGSRTQGFLTRKPEKAKKAKIVS